MRGRSNFKLGDLQAAVQDYKKAIELNPQARLAWGNLGGVYYRQQDYEEAIRCFSKSLEVRPTQFSVLWRRSQCYQELGDQQAAENDREIAMSAEYDTDSDLISRAQVLRTIDAERALEDLQRAHEINPDRAYTLALIARVLSVNLDRHEEAIEYFTEQLAIQPNDEYALMGRALSLVRLGRHQEAIIDTQQAMRPPNMSSNHYQAACVFAMIGGEEYQRRAVQHLCTAVSMGYTKDDKKGVALDEDLASIREMPGFKASVRVHNLSMHFKERIKHVHQQIETPRSETQPPETTDSETTASETTTSETSRTSRRTINQPGLQSTLL